MIHRIGAAWILAGLLVSAPVGADSDPHAHPLVLPTQRPINRVMAALYRANDEDNLQAIKQIATSAADHTEVLARLLFTPGTDRERQHALAKRYTEYLAEDSASYHFGKHWLDADQAAYDQEREFWKTSMRIGVAGKRGTHKDALALAESAMADVRAAEHSYARYMIWEQYAVLLNVTKRHDASLRELRAMARVAEHSGDFGRVARYRVNELATLRRYGSAWKDIVKSNRQAVAAAIRVRDWPRVAELYTLQGGDHQERREFEDADAMYARALAVADQIHATDYRSFVHVRMAVTEEARGRSDRARALSLAAWRACKESKNPTDIETALRAAAYLIGADRGSRLSSALALAEWSKRTLKQHKRVDRYVRAVITHALAALAETLGDDKRALDLHFEVVDLTRGHRRFLLRRAAALLGALRASASKGAGQLPPARVSEFSNAVDQLGDSAFALRALTMRSRLERLQDRPQAALDSATRALALAETIQASDRDRALAEYAHAKALVRMGDSKNAMARLSRFVQTRPTSHLRGFALALLAACQFREGAFDRSTKNYVAALAHQSERWVGVGEADVSSFQQSRSDMASRGMRAALKWIQAHPEQRAAATAAVWQLGELRRAQLLIQAVARHQQKGTSTTNASERAHEDALQALERAHRKFVVALTTSDMTRQKEARTQVDRALADVRERGRVADRARAALKAMPRAISLNEAMATLRPHQGILRFHAVAGQLAGLAVTGGKTALMIVGDTKSIAADVASWRDMVSVAGGRDEVLAARLFDRLVRPFARVLGTCKELVFIPNGTVATIPIDAFIATSAKPPHPATRWIEQVSLTYSPSFGVYRAFHAQRTPSPQATGVVALGAIQYPRQLNNEDLSSRLIASRSRGSTALPPLPATREEAKSVAGLYPRASAQIFLGAHASMDSLRKALGDTKTRLDVLHIATHGITDNRTPMLSGLVLAGGTVLTAERIARWDLRHVELAVLSACNSGSHTFAPGEGLLGLTRSFMVAGVPQIICTTWQVADKHAARFMVSMHKRRIQSRRTSSALRETRLEALRNPLTAHPFHWAGYQLWGTN